MKNLNGLLAPYKYFSLSSPEDNRGLLDFFKSVTMDTRAFSLRYDRGDDFFAFTKEQSGHVYTFLMKDEEGVIKGCASIALIPHFINGAFELCAYLGDLRISSKLNPKIRILWKKCYGEIIAHFSELEEFKGVKFLYSAILNENQNAMRSLLKNNDQLFYHELTSYQTINVFAAKPLSQKRVTKFSLDRSATEAEIRAFLAKKADGPGLNHFIRSEVDADDELKRRLKTWGNFRISDFLVIKNNKDEIVAVTAPWQSLTKKLVLEKMSIPLKVLGKLVPLLKIPKIQVKSPVNVMSLTHLTFSDELSAEDKIEVMSLFLNELLKNKKRNFHIISFFTFPHWQLGSLPFYYQTTDARFYQVMSKSQYEGRAFADLHNVAPAFELGIS